MPKRKTHKGTVKRFKITASGKVLRRMAGHGHLLAHKSRKRKRNYLRKRVSKSLDARRIKRLLGYIG